MVPSNRSRRGSAAHYYCRKRCSMRIDRQWEPNGLNPQTVLLVLSPFRILATVKNLLLWRRLKTDPKSRAVWDQFFSESDYLQTYPDVANAGTNPQLHFLL